MTFRSVNISDYYYSLSEFTQKCEKNSIIVIKTGKLAKLLEEQSQKSMRFKEIKPNIFLLESFGNHFVIPASFEKCTKIYYIYSENCNFESEEYIVKYLSRELIADFLEQIDYKHNKWQVVSKAFIDGKLYVKVKSKSTSNSEIEYWFSDLYACIWDVDYKWSNFLHESVLKTLLEDYYNEKWLIALNGL